MKNDFMNKKISALKSKKNYNRLTFLSVNSSNEFMWKYMTEQQSVAYLLQTVNINSIY